MQEIASYSKVIAPYKKSVHLTPDADCTKEMVDKSLVEVEKVFESQAV